MATARTNTRHLARLHYGIRVGYRKAVALILTSVLGGLLVACAPPDAAERGPVATRPPTRHDGRPVAVWVEGQPIHDAELKESVDRMVALGESGLLIREEDGASARVGFGAEGPMCEEMLIRFVYDELMRQEAARRGIFVDDNALSNADATAVAAVEAPVAATEVALAIQRTSGLDDDEFEAARREELRLEIMRRAVNGMLTEELGTTDRAAIDTYWEQLWARSEVRPEGDPCARLYPQSN